MKENKNILNRAYLAAIPFGLLALGILTKLLIIQYAEGPELRSEAENEVFRQANVKAERGNIYSANGQLLATSMPVYNIYFDPLTVSEADFTQNINALSKHLATTLPEKSHGQWMSYLKQERSKGNRYVYIASKQTFSRLQELKSFPIFNLGKYKGGLIYEQENFRKMPLGKIAERTVGRDRKYSSTGLEGAYRNILKGKDGKRLKQKVSNGNWKPVTDNFEIAPQNGRDILTTINTRIQDVAHHELLRTLERFEADHGCVVVMEVETGAIRAISNLGRTSDGTYFEQRNYAIWESTEPGSTFKLASVMAALEDGLADTNTLVDTENGEYFIFNKKIKDSNNKGYGKVSLKRAFEVSSNVGIVKVIHNKYKNNPNQFVDRLYNIGLDQKLGLPIKGEGQALIPKPGDPNWSGISLPWMSFGYQVSFTPLQILTLYNAVANNGTMVKPKFLEEIREHGRTIETIETEILNPAICSKETLNKLQDLLEGVVENGTAINIKSNLVKMAGKTGTCQQNYWKESTNDYQASFAGYFPADSPKYSCIVVINKPNYHRGYYGSTVAAPVFKAIAENIHSNTPKVNRIEQNNLQELLHADAQTFKLRAGQTLPNLRGLNGAEIISQLENQGFKVKVTGNGKVIWHYPNPGSVISKSDLIELKLG